MPIYEYQCDSCETRFDAIRKFSDPPLTACRSCGAEGIRKLMSAPAFRLKGGGWYETDFKKNNQRNVAASEGDSGTKSDTASAPAADSGGPAKQSSAESKSTAGDSGSSSGSASAA